MFFLISILLVFKILFCLVSILSLSLIWLFWILGKIIMLRFICNLRIFIFLLKLLILVLIKIKKWSCCFMLLLIFWKYGLLICWSSSWSSILSFLLMVIVWFGFFGWGICWSGIGLGCWRWGGCLGYFDFLFFCFWICLSISVIFMVLIKGGKIFFIDCWFLLGLYISNFKFKLWFWF